MKGILNCANVYNLHNSRNPSLTGHTFYKLFYQYLFSISINLVIGHNHHYYLHLSCPGLGPALSIARKSIRKNISIIYGRISPFSTFSHSFRGFVMGKCPCISSFKLEIQNRIGLRFKY